MGKDDTDRRDFIAKATAPAVLGVVATALGPAAQAQSERDWGKVRPLPPRRFAQFLRKLLHMVENRESEEYASSSLDDLLEEFELRAEMLEQAEFFSDLLKAPPPNWVEAQECGACGACALCTACAELNAGAIGAAAAAVYALA